MGKYDGIKLEAKVLRVIDGDTIECIVDCPFHFQYRDNFRLKGINAPEKSGETKEAGLAAKAFVEELLNGETVVLEVFKQEKYGRYLATVYHNDVNVNDLLLEKGFAKPYEV